MVERVGGSRSTVVVVVEVREPLRLCPAFWSAGAVVPTALPIARVLGRGTTWLCTSRPERKPLCSLP